MYKPIIAAVNGFCVAGGCEIMLGTDIRVACEEASFGVPEVRWSLLAAGGGCIRLARQIPWARAKRICQNGPYAVRKAKEVLVRGYNMAWDEAFALESLIAQDVFASEDAKEGPKAFAEKRMPNFKNR